MRKESRAMDSQWALEVMYKAPYMTVSFIDEDGKPYGLPLSLASDDDVNWYFHGALEGKKLEAIKARPEVCLSAVTRCTPRRTAVSPCNTNLPSHSARQKSWQMKQRRFMASD